MSKFFYRNQGFMSERHALEHKYTVARSNLIFVIACTLVNIILLLANINRYFLFSAYIPYFLTDMGMFLCGKYPQEVYTEEFPNMQFLSPSVLVAMTVLAFVITGLYLLCWLLSKKQKGGWLTFALVLFVIDTLGMFVLSGFAFNSFLNIVFHIWVIYYLAMGIYAHSKLKTLPVEPVISEEEARAQEEEDAIKYGSDAPSPEPEQAEEEVRENSPILRRADNTVKFRVLLEATAFGHNVCYRRVKRVNELVIDSMVYDEYVALMERSHELNATVDGHDFAISFDGTIGCIYLVVDGTLFAKKRRLI